MSKLKKNETIELGASDEHNNNDDDDDDVD